MSDTFSDYKWALLQTSLECAVPMWMHELQHFSSAHLHRRAHHCAQVVAEKGDVLQFKGKGSAEAFNRLAEGIAVMALLIGKVDVLGCHFEAPPGYEVAS